MDKKYKITYLLHNEQQLIAEDGENGDYGDASFRQFKAKDTVVINTGKDVYHVPFHAIIWAKVEVTTEQVTPAKDEFCNYEGC